MRANVVAACLVAGLVPLAGTGTAHADRIPVITLGGTLDLRFASPTWDETEKKQTPTVFGGGQVTLAFEDRPLALTPYGKPAASARLVPELIAGVLSGDQYAEGYVGAGVRAELHIAGPKARAGFYIAARGLVIGQHRDAAGEFMMGDYLLGARGVRIGVEGGAMVRPDDRDGNHELDAVMRVYLGWQLAR